MKDERMDFKRELWGFLKTGGYKQGDKLPPERTLCQQFGVSRATLREALSILVERDILTRRQGSGSFVNKLPHKSSTNIVGVMIPQLDNAETIYSKVVQALETELSLRGHSLLLGNHGNDGQKAEAFIARAADLNSAGVALVPLLAPEAEAGNLKLLRRLEAAGLPFVVFDSQIPGARRQYSYVGIDNFRAMLEMVEHLHRRGHRRIAYIRGLDNVASSDQRHHGFLEGMSLRGLAFPPEFDKAIKQGNVADQGRQELKELMGLASPPTAVACTHDHIALNVLEELARLGLRVPEDVAVVGFDDIDLGGNVAAALTTVRQPAEAEAKAVAELLFDKIEGRLQGERQELLQGTLVVRKSCGGGMK